MSARFDVSETAAYVLFDQNVEVPTPGSWNAATFRINQSSRWYQTGVVSRSSLNEIRITGVSATIVPGTATIQYDSSMGTVMGANGLRAPSFAGVACPPVA